MTILAVLLLAVQANSAAPEARDVFQDRQRDLVLLAGKLGSLHRLHQVCQGHGSIDLYRDRMKQVIEGERPPRGTREAMIDNFNDNYRTAARMYYSCSPAAEADFREDAAAALGITDRLAGPIGF